MLLRIWCRLRKRWLLTLAYVFLLGAGILVFTTGSAPTSIAHNTNVYVEHAWGLFCLGGSTVSLTGVGCGRLDVELVGLPLATSSALMWAAAIVLEARGQGNTLAAAFMAAALAGLLMQRFADNWLLLRKDNDERRK